MIKKNLLILLLLTYSVPLVCMDKSSSYSLYYRDSASSASSSTRTDMKENAPQKTRPLTFIPSEKYPLHRACALGCISDVRRLIDKADQNEKDDKGNTPLHYVVAAKKEKKLTPLAYVEAAEKILTIVHCFNHKIINLNIRNNEGLTPTMIAQLNGHRNIIKYFESLGDKDIRQKELKEFAEKEQLKDEKTEQTINQHPALNIPEITADASSLTSPHTQKYVIPAEVKQLPAVRIGLQQQHAPVQQGCLSRALGAIVGCLNSLFCCCSH